MNTLLLMIAILLTAALFVPLLVLQSVRRRKTIGDYHFNLAKNIDYMWCSLLFAEDGHTVSAMCWQQKLQGKRKYVIFVKVIDFLFGDETHCQSAYIHEFGVK